MLLNDHSIPVFIANERAIPILHQLIFQTFTDAASSNGGLKTVYI